MREIGRGIVERLEVFNCFQRLTAELVGAAFRAVGNLHILDNWGRRQRPVPSGRVNERSSRLSASRAFAARAF